MFRRVVIPVAFFLAILFAGDRMGGAWIDRVMMQTKFRYPQLYTSDLPADIVVLGNSRALHMFHPPALEEVSNLKTVNLSFNALPTALMPALWEDYLDRHDPPRQLILEVSCVGREDDEGALERFTALMAHSPRISREIAYRNLTEYWSSQLSHLYRYNSEFTLRSLFFFRTSDQDWITQGTVSAPQLKRIMSHGIEPLVRPDDHVDAFQRIISIANRNDVKVELILAPYHPDYLPAVTELPGWFAWLKRELDCPIDDYRDAIVDRSGFADHIHLNPAGAKQFARILAGDGAIVNAQHRK